jgi:hypothetical protein
MPLQATELLEFSGQPRGVGGPSPVSSPQAQLVKQGNDLVCADRPRFSVFDLQVRGEAKRADL